MVHKACRSGYTAGHDTRGLAYPFPGVGRDAFSRGTGGAGREKRIGRRGADRSRHVGRPARGAAGRCGTRRGGGLRGGIVRGRWGPKRPYRGAFPVRSARTAGRGPRLSAGTPPRPQPSDSGQAGPAGHSHGVCGGDGPGRGGGRPAAHRPGHAVHGRGGQSQGSVYPLPGQPRSGLRAQDQARFRQGGGIVAG